ncbi:hypothetical protein FKP32DRAFT_31574 [Trametes sanguinea]|nr:hypothetical protein FKP32DRAFT_31574 [Trametes sanguinea]
MARLRSPRRPALGLPIAPASISSPIGRTRMITRSPLCTVTQHARFALTAGFVRSYVGRQHSAQRGWSKRLFCAVSTDRMCIYAYSRTMDIRYMGVCMTTCLLLHVDDGYQYNQARRADHVRGGRA